MVEMRGDSQFHTPLSGLQDLYFQCAVAHGEERVFVDSAGQPTQFYSFNLYGSPAGIK